MLSAADENTNHLAMVRINVTLNVTLVDGAPLTRGNARSGR
jgi:hypothetical protein